MDVHKVPSVAIRPCEFALEPRQPTSVADQLFYLGQPPTDLDDIADDPLAEPANFGGMLGKRIRPRL